jgi:hypothetical protein
MDTEEPEEAAQDPSSKVPIGQGTVIPLGWKPTVQQPVPVVRCVIIKKDGNRCGRWSMRGMTKCYAHGRRELAFPNVQKHKEAVIEAARMRLLDASDEAVDTLEQLLQPGTSEGIRLKAATEILDRNGIRGGFEVDVQVETKEDPAELLTKRLNQLRERHAAQQELVHGDVLDADVVDEDEDHQQDTLF